MFEAVNTTLGSRLCINRNYPKSNQTFKNWNFKLITFTTNFTILGANLMLNRDRQHIYFHEKLEEFRAVIGFCQKICDNIGIISNWK